MEQWQRGFIDLIKASGRAVIELRARWASGKPVAGRARRHRLAARHRLDTVDYDKLAAKSREPCKVLWGCGMQYQIINQVDDTNARWQMTEQRCEFSGRSFGQTIALD
jgi:hypothetical protein